MCSSLPDKFRKNLRDSSFMELYEIFSYQGLDLLCRKQSLSDCPITDTIFYCSIHDFPAHPAAPSGGGCPLLRATVAAGDKKKHVNMNTLMNVPSNHRITHTPSLFFL